MNNEMYGYQAPQPGQGNRPQNTTAIPGQAPQYMHNQGQPAQGYPTQVRQGTESFNPDEKTATILSSVYPELTNAMICLAIKKFSTSDDFLNYFIREEFKQQAEQEAEQINQASAPAAQSAPAAAPSSGGVSFDSW